MSNDRRTGIHKGSMTDKALTVIKTATRETPYTAERVEEEILLKYPGDKTVPAQIAQALFNLVRKRFVSREKQLINGLGKKRYVYFPYDHTLPLAVKAKRTFKKRKNSGKPATFDDGTAKPSVTELVNGLNAPTKQSVAAKFLTTYAQQDQLMLDMAVARMRTLDMATLMDDAKLTAPEIATLLQGD